MDFSPASEEAQPCDLDGHSKGVVFLLFCLSKKQSYGCELGEVHIPDMMRPSTIMGDASCDMSLSHSSSLPTTSLFAIYTLF